MPSSDFNPSSQIKSTREKTETEIASLSHRIVKQVNKTRELSTELELRDAAQSERTEGVLGLLKSEMTRVNLTLERDAHKTVQEKAKIQKLKLEKAKWEVEREKLHRDEAREKLLERDKRDLEKENRSRTMAKERIDYETSMKEASANRLEMKRRETEEALIRQRAAAELEKANVEIEVAIAKAKAEAEGKMKQERENEDVRLRLEKEKGEAQRKRLLDAINLIFARITDSGREFFGDAERVARSLGALVLLVAGIYFVREFSKVFAREIERRLGKPSLVRETSRMHASQTGSFTFLLLLIRSFFGMLQPIYFALRSKEGSEEENEDEKNASETLSNRLANIPEFQDVILSTSCEQRVMELAAATRNAQKNRAPYRHLLFYGPAGTGKSMVAKRLAHHSGMDWAIMSGGDVGPLGEQAVTDLHNLFEWARSTSRGLMLFIDEAEAFLGSRAKSADNMTVHMRNALNALLFQTGDQSKHFMLVLATNRAADLDAAVLDRVDEAVHFSLPGKDQRLDIASEYFNEHILSRAPRTDLSCIKRCLTFSGKTLDRIFCGKGAAICGNSLAVTREIRLEDFEKVTKRNAKKLFSVFANPNEDSDFGGQEDDYFDEEAEEEEAETRRDAKAKPATGKGRGRRKRASTPLRSKKKVNKLHEKANRHMYHYQDLPNILSKIECEDGTARGVQYCMDEISQATSGFSGRQIAKMMISCQGMIYGTTKSALTPEMLVTLVKRKVDEHQRKMEMRSLKSDDRSRSTDNRYNYA